ncbi:hypothetical protein FDP41_013735 [Naegleria fowleri]|uniref:Uncharacterized protein n=1 Tax=Naegleria fowleri TaxID=5763 RepID=A0A6A5C0S2_NAEFO|nr:uncharacterized protein FDP41_013735 [Naegleria fowleri]KAF0980521.1 hypothetical protein FDP41_013735 [Naegleria fowleri]
MVGHGEPSEKLIVIPCWLIPNLSETQLLDTFGLINTVRYIGEEEGILKFILVLTNDHQDVYVALCVRSDSKNPVLLFVESLPYFLEVLAVNELNTMLETKQRVEGFRANRQFSLQILFESGKISLPNVPYLSQAKRILLYINRRPFYAKEIRERVHLEEGDDNNPNNFGTVIIGNYIESSSICSDQNASLSHQDPPPSPNKKIFFNIYITNKKFVKKKVHQKPNQTYIHTIQNNHTNYNPSKTQDEIRTTLKKLKFYLIEEQARQKLNGNSSAPIPVWTNTHDKHCLFLNENMFCFSDAHTTTSELWLCLNPNEEYQFKIYDAKILNAQRLTNRRVCQLKIQFKQSAQPVRKFIFEVTELSTKKSAQIWLYRVNTPLTPLLESLMNYSILKGEKACEMFKPLKFKTASMKEFEQFSQKFNTASECELDETMIHSILKKMLIFCSVG